MVRFSCVHVPHLFCLRFFHATCLKIYDNLRALGMKERVNSSIRALTHSEPPKRIQTEDNVDTRNVNSVLWIRYCLFLFVSEQESAANHFFFCRNFSKHSFWPNCGCETLTAEKKRFSTKTTLYTRRISVRKQQFHIFWEFFCHQKRIKIKLNR